MTNLRSFQPGIGTFAWVDDGLDPWGVPQQAPDMTTLKHYHTDMIGTTRMMTDSGGAADSPATFTAFGARISGSAQRYGYAGAYGYQTASSDDPLDAYAAGFKFLHVGARYYDPATGRFLQRDPIGIYGGPNVYAYVYNNPLLYIDPSGLGPIDAIKKAVGAVKAALLRLLGKNSPATTLVRPIDVTARALRGGPDLVRCAVGIGHRNKSFRNSTSADDFLNRYQRGHGKYVKPGSGG